MKNTYKLIRRFNFLKQSRWTVWYMFVLYYMALRLVIGLFPAVIYGYIILLLILDVPIGAIIFVFVCNSVLAYIFGQFVEANHYLSYVWGLMVITTIIEIAKISLRKHKSSSI